MGPTLNEQSVRKLLTEAVEHLQAGRPEKGGYVLEILDFKRLTGHGQVIDPASPFGRPRVYDTGSHIEACQDSLSRGDVTAALRHAEAALTRWTAGKTTPEK
jgi:hypothetical protein